MDKNNIAKNKVKGEVSGAFLLGIYESFCQVNCLMLDEKYFEIADISAEKWYPYSMIIEQLELIENKNNISENIYFQAGINFLRNWYEFGPGKTMIFSGLDWLKSNINSAGYNSVVRGGTPEEIGWCRCQFLDETAGIAVYEDVTPFHPEFAKGLFYGGCILFDDMDYISVDCSILPYPQNPLFTKKIITVQFHNKKNQISDEVTKKLTNLELGNNEELSSEEIECLIWRYKGLCYESELKEAYFKDTSYILSKTLNEIHRLNLELDNANNRLLYLAETDPLTGILNRRKFIQQAEVEFGRAIRTQIPLSLLSLDLDHFKQINDKWGHAAGDEVLIHFTKTISSLLRNYDLFSRMGGEEFLILLPGTEIKGAEKTAHRILEVIREQKIEFNGIEIFYTVSIGVVLLQEGDNLETFFSRGDSALYKAKENGRNRVYINIK